MSQSTNRTQLNESLSALVDDEASELEIHRILTESQQDPGVRERWHRYQVARAALKGEVVDLHTTQFADRVRDAIDHTEFDQPAFADDPAGKALSEKKTVGVSRWKSSAGRVAIAASVAAAVLIGTQQMNLLGLQGQSSESFAQQPTESAPAEPSSNRINVPTINVQNVSGGDAISQRSRLPQHSQYSPSERQQLQDEQIRRYIRQLMFEHAAHSAQNSGSGLLPYARVPAEEEQ